MLLVLSGKVKLLTHLGPDDDNGHDQVTLSTIRRAIQFLRLKPILSNEIMVRGVGISSSPFRRQLVQRKRSAITSFYTRQIRWNVTEATDW